jgi:two-component system phosphate regulon sensor histidine kinase PhoR
MNEGARDWFPYDDLKRLVPAVRRELVTSYRDGLRREQIDALRQSDQLKDQYMNMLSHELRLPLTVINGFGSAMLDGMAGSITEEQRQYLKRILDACDKLTAFVKDLLDASLVKAGMFSVHPRPMKLKEITRGIIESLGPLAGRKHQVLIDEVSDWLPPLMADDRRVGQVVSNLVQNAIKFTPEGGTIRVSAHTEGERIRCEVADSGIGIRESDIPRLFKRFSQLERSEGGIGLGLSIVKGIVEAHGGTIGVESEPGIGSTFWFTLPLARTIHAAPNNSPLRISLSFAT